MHETGRVKKLSINNDQDICHKSNFHAILRLFKKSFDVLLNGVISPFLCNRAKPIPTKGCIPHRNQPFDMRYK